MSCERPRFDCSFRNGDDVIHIAVTAHTPKVGLTFESFQEADEYSRWICSAWLAADGWRYYTRVETVDRQCARSKDFLADATTLAAHYLAAADHD